MQTAAPMRVRPIAAQGPASNNPPFGASSRYSTSVAAAPQVARISALWASFFNIAEPFPADRRAGLPSLTMRYNLPGRKTTHNWEVDASVNGYTARWICMRQSRLASTKLIITTAVAISMIVCAWAQAQSPDSQPASRPANGPTGISHVREAMDLLERVDGLAEAQRQLDLALPHLPEGGLGRHAVEVLRGQLAGDPAQPAWRNRQVGDVVVLVPDERSFWAALGHWTGDRFFPVLIEDGWLTPMFVEAFAPRQIVRWSAPADDPEPSDDATDAKPPNGMPVAFMSLVNDHNRSLAGQTDAQPAGVVVLDPTDPLRSGGLALALGRGQPILMLHTEEPVEHVLSEEQAATINAGVMLMSAKWNVFGPERWRGLTLAGPYPYRYRRPSKTHHYFALDDRLGRTPQGVRLGVVGRLTGSAVQGVYQANCSLFLQPRRVLLADDYSNRKAPQWRHYRLNKPAKVLAPRFEITQLRFKQATMGDLRSAVRPRHDFDMIWMTSSGNAEYFTFGSRGWADDVPVGHAAAMYLAHSFGVANPWRAGTIGGRAVIGGAYWLFGSVYEPFLHSFVLPTGMSHKVMAGAPLAFAARQLPGNVMSQPWRLMLVGDPLFALRDEPATRVDMPPLPGAVQINKRTASDAQQPARQRLRDAAMIMQPGDEAQLAITELALQNPTELDDSDLVRAMYTLWWAGRRKAMAEVDVEQMRRHPLTHALGRRHLSGIYRRQLDRTRLDAARATLVRLIGLGGNRQQLTTQIRRWQVEMSKRGRGTEALDFLTDQANEPWPGASIKALQQVLKQAGQKPGAAPAKSQ